MNRRPADPSELIIRNYNHSSTVPLATPEYLRRHGVPKSPEDLRQHTGLLHKAFSDDTVTQQLFQNGRGSEILRWRKTFVTHDQLTLKRLLLEHHGITVDLSIIHCGEELKRGEVVPILRGWQKAPWNMCLVNRREDELKNAKLRNFVLWITAAARDDMRAWGVENDRIIAEAYERFEAQLAAGELGEKDAEAAS